MPKVVEPTAAVPDPAPRNAAPAPPVYWVAAESLIYISTKTGKWVIRRQREIIDDLPALSTIPATATTRARTGPNWVIGEGLVQPYTGDQTAGHVVPRADAEVQYGGPLPGTPEPDTLTDAAPVAAVKE